MRRFLHRAVGTALVPPRPRGDAGLSQSTENAILLAGAVSIAVAVVTAVTAYVTAKLPQP